MSTKAFIELWEDAIVKYLDTTNRSESEQRVLKQIKTFEQLDEKLENDHRLFSAFRERHASLRHRFKYFTQPINALSNLASGVLGLTPFAPASTIFGALTFLVKATEGVSAAYDWIDQLFDQLENFTARLVEYCTVEIPEHLAENAVKILACLLGILAQSEKTINSGRFKKYVGAVFRGEDRVIKDSFDKLAGLFDNEERVVLAINFATGQRMEQRTTAIQESVEKTLSLVQKIGQAGEEVERSRQTEKELQLRKKILKWISRTNFPALQDDIFRRRQDGTGLWFLDDPKFKTWLTTPKQTLFSPGMKGAGKTIIAATVIDHLANLSRTGDTGLAYIFYNYKERSESSATNMLSAILKQLLIGQPDIPLPTYVTELYDSLSMTDRKLGLEHVYEALECVLTRYRRVYIIVDALDECNHPDRVDLIRNLTRLQEDCDLRLLFTSRDIPEISHHFHADTTLEVRANQQDITLYVKNQMPSLSRCIQKDDDLRNNVLEKVVAASDGMFLIAVLHIDSIRPLKIARHVVSALDRIGSKTLNDSYIEAITRIDEQPSYDKELAWRALSWIFHAKRQLTTRELCHILSLEPGVTSISDGDAFDIEDIISVCAGLLTVDKMTGVVRLIHYTTQEYLESIMWEDHTKHDIALDCVAYMSLHPFRSGGISDQSVLDQRLRENAFYRYAAEFWKDHVRPIQFDRSPRMESYTSFLCNSELIDSMIQANDHREYDELLMIRHRGRTRGLHLTLRYDLTELAKLIIAKHLEIKEDLDCRDEYSRTALMIAADYGYEEIAELLIATNKVDVTKRDEHGRTPLHLAAAEGHQAIVELFLDAAADPDAFDDRGQTSLSIAAQRGRADVVRLLLQPELIETAEVDPDARDGDGRTPLTLAILSRKEEIVKLLLDAQLLETGKVNPEFISNTGGTPLWLAAVVGHEEIVRLLLDTQRVKPDTAFKGSTPLWEAVNCGNRNIVKLLLDTGAVDPDTICQGTTALWLSLYKRDADTAKLLLETGKVDPDKKMAHDETALRSVVEWENEELVKLLLDTGRVDPTAQDEDGDTPLSRARELELDGITSMFEEYLVARASTKNITVQSDGSSIHDGVTTMEE